MRTWARLRGLELRVTDGGQHWQFRGRHNGNKFMADWWPSSAKLIVNQKWDNGIHAHDYQQVIDLLEAAVAKFYRLPVNFGKRTYRRANRRSGNGIHRGATKRGRSGVPV